MEDEIFSHKVPSADPEVKRAIEELLKDPAAYHERVYGQQLKRAEIELDQAVSDNLKAAHEARALARRSRLERLLGKLGAFLSRGEGNQAA